MEPLSVATQGAFAVFIEDKSSFALLLDLADNDRFESRASIRWRHPSFQLELNELERHLDVSQPVYIVLRRNDLLTFITYVLYRVRDNVCSFFLDHRHDVVRQFGDQHITCSMICKEIAEITDARSWVERDAETVSRNTTSTLGDNLGSHISNDPTEDGTKDVGYRKNKCRLCDRRMKNKITSDALEALNLLQTPKAAVQISVDMTTNTLILNYTKTNTRPEDIAATLPPNTPSFTFYRHPATHLLYFIFHSPDTATVQQRMKHTLAIPGLINVHAPDQAVHVDQKIEIHDPHDLVFDAEDERIGRFRSVYLRNEFQGTESRYETLEADKIFYEKVE